MRTNDEHTERLRALLNEQFERTELVRTQLSKIVQEAELIVQEVKVRSNATIDACELELSAIREKLNELAPGA